MKYIQSWAWWDLPIVPTLGSKGRKIVWEKPGPHSKNKSNLSYVRWPCLEKQSKAIWRCCVEHLPSMRTGPGFSPRHLTVYKLGKATSWCISVHIWVRKLQICKEMIAVHSSSICGNREGGRALIERGAFWYLPKFWVMFSRVITIVY